MKIKMMRFQSVLLAVVLLFAMAAALPAVPVKAGSTIQVTFSLIGDDIHGEGAHKAFYTWIGQAKKTYSASENKTVFDLMTDVFKEKGFQAFYDKPSYIWGVRTPDGVELGEYSNGPLSGWQYIVENGTETRGADDPMNQCILQDGDAVYMYYADKSGDPLPDAQDVPVAMTLPAAKTLYPQQTYDLSKQLKVSPSYAAVGRITWKSSNKQVATVNANGIVTAKAAGTTVITALSADTGLSAACKITVKKPALKLNYSSIQLQKGTSTALVKVRSVSPAGSKMKKATSNKKAVATAAVKNGKLTIKGKKAGTAVITVTSTNGAQAKVTVKVKKKLPTKKLSLNTKSAVLKKGKKMTLKVTRTPVTAADTLTWVSSDRKIASVSKKGVVKALKKGKVTITVKAGKKVKASCKVKIK